MKQFSPTQRELVSSLVSRLGAIPGIKAIVLGGSYARGRAQADSDIDLGLFYLEATPFSIERVRDIAEQVNNTPRPVVTEFYGWGPWVNGGAWLTIGGQRVDLIYRSFEKVEQVIAEAEAGRYEVHYLQQPPFGFFSPTYLGDISACIPLVDPERRMGALKQRLTQYPETLRQAIVRDYLFMAQFTLAPFAAKFAARSDTCGTGACLARAVNELIVTLFALNRKYPANEKTSLAEIAEFEHAPAAFAERAQKALARLGNTPAELSAAVESITQLLQETIALAGGLYHPPKW